MRELLNPQEALYLDNDGESFRFDLVGLAIEPHLIESPQSANRLRHPSTATGSLQSPNAKEAATLRTAHST